MSVIARPDPEFCKVNGHTWQSRKRSDTIVSWQVSCHVCGIWYDSCSPVGDVLSLGDKSDNDSNTDV